MPAPAKATLEPVIIGLLTSAGINGENAPDLAAAIAEAWAGALDQFLTQVQVAPGIPCTPAATAGPGQLV